MEQVKDWIYVIVIGGGALTAIGRSVFLACQRIKKHDERLDDHEERIGCLESEDSITNRKLEILNANVVQLLNKFKLEPVRDLFNDERGDQS